MIRSSITGTTLRPVAPLLWTICSVASGSKRRRVTTVLDMTAAMTNCPKPHAWNIGAATTVVSPDRHGIRSSIPAIAELPRAVETPDPVKRAAVVEAANDRFARMLDDLAVLTPAGEDGAVVTAWLADWAVYLGDRSAYAEALRTDPDARLLVTPKQNEQVTEFIDAFAKDNRMPSCGTPLDVS